MASFEDEPGWVYPRREHGQEMYDNVDGDSQSDEDLVVVDTVISGDGEPDYSVIDVLSPPPEDHQRVPSSEVMPYDDSSEEKRTAASYYNESGLMGSLPNGFFLGEPEGGSSLSVFPEGYGGLGPSVSTAGAFPSIQVEQGHNEYPPDSTSAGFQDDLGPSSLHYTSSMTSSASSGGEGLESFPDDESQDSAIPKHMTARRIGRALLLCSAFLMIIFVTVTIVLLKRTKANESEQARTAPTTAQMVTTVPTGAPETSDALEPLPTLMPSPILDLAPSFGPRTVTVPVHNDGYLGLGGMLLRDIEVQHTSTLLVQDGYHHTAAMSIVEFDTSGTIIAPSLIDDSVTSAIISLTVANGDVEEGDEIVTLYARMYPNEQGTTPDIDIDKYGFGAIDFKEGWIPFDFSLYQTSQIQLDVTQYFLGQYFPSQNSDLRENVKLLIAHDNSDGRENLGVQVRFYSSDAISKRNRPNLTIQVDPPKFTRSPAPSTSPFPSLGPTVSFAPSTSMSPSVAPSGVPSYQPSSSWSPTFHPTISPAPTIQSYPICNICGMLELSNPQAKLTDGRGGGLGSRGIMLPRTCGSLQQAGLQGEIPSKQCMYLQTEVGDTCCQEPEDTDRFVCNLCGGSDNEAGNIVSPDAVVVLPLADGTRTCQQYGAQAELGLIDESMCKVLQPYSSVSCCGILV